MRLRGPRVLSKSEARAVELEGFLLTGYEFQPVTPPQIGKRFSRDIFGCVKPESRFVFEYEFPMHP